MLVVIIVPILLHFLLVKRYHAKMFWSGVVVGAVAGVIMALVRDNWWILADSLAVGSWAGLGVEWVYGLVEEGRSRRELHR